MAARLKGQGMRFIWALLALGLATAARAQASSGSIDDFIARELPISGGGRQVLRFLPRIVSSSASKPNTANSMVSSL